MLQLLPICKEAGEIQRGTNCVNYLTILSGILTRICL
jgi:hypothetical protein